jgi:hypothetical protein
VANGFDLKWIVQCPHVLALWSQQGIGPKPSLDITPVVSPPMSPVSQLPAGFYTILPNKSQTNNSQKQTSELAMVHFCNLQHQCARGTLMEFTLILSQLPVST